LDIALDFVGEFFLEPLVVFKLWSFVRWARLSVDFL